MKGGYPDPGLLALPGRERMWSSRTGRAPIPPIVYLVGMSFDQVSRGFATFTIPASPLFANATGLVPGGMLAVLADAPLGAALGSEMAPWEMFTTAELSLTFLRPVQPDPEVVISGSGQLIHRSRTVGLTEAFLTNEATEELVAFASSRLSIFPPPDPSPEPPDQPPDQPDPPAGDPEQPPDTSGHAPGALPQRPEDDPDHPSRRPLQGEILDLQVFETRSGREIIEAFISGELPPPPVHYLTGLRPVEVGDGECEMAMPCSPWLSTSARTVQGGFTAMLAESCLAGAAFSTAEAGTAVAPLDLKVNFLRPVQPDMRDLTGRARVVHRGRTLTVSSAELTGADGKRVALATGSAMYLPGRPANLAGVEFGGAEPGA